MEIEEKIKLVRLLVGDIPSSDFYPLFQDEEIVSFLTLCKEDVQKAAIYAAHSASLLLSGFNTMEKIGDLTMRNEMASNYLKALKELISTADKRDEAKVYIPWGLGISVKEIKDYSNNPDRLISPLLKIHTCDKGVASFAGGL